jgi:hypothetical protein
VGVIEAWHDKFFVEVNRFGVGIAAAFEHDQRDRADANNLSVADGHGLRPRMLRIVSVDAAMQVSDEAWSLLRYLSV